MSFWSGRVDPDGNTYNFYVCGAPNNRMGYCNDEVDRLLNEAREERDPAKRKALYKQAMDIKDHDRPDLSLWYRQLFAATRANVEGFKLFADGQIRLVGVTLK
jgi:peptide/nickel transport system substrate-binding protein